MKRSEMLAKIFYHVPGDEYWGADWEVAERILKEIEEAGMLPPICERGFGPDGLSRKTPPSHKWDPEE